LEVWKINRSNVGEAFTAPSNFSNVKPEPAERRVLFLGWQEDNSRMPEMKQYNIFRMWWSYHRKWAWNWLQAVRPSARENFLGVVAGIIAAMVGWRSGYIAHDKLWSAIVIGAAGYGVIFFCYSIAAALFTSSKIDHGQVSEIEKLTNEVAIKTGEYISAKQEALDVHTKDLRTQEQLVKALHELAQAEKTISDSSNAFHEQYAEVVRLRGEVAAKDKDHELATLTPPANQPKVKLQARGIAHIQYDHKEKMYTHLFDGTGNGFSIVIQILNLAVRGASNKPIRVRAQAKYICDGVTTLLSPLVWLESPTSDIVLEPGEIRELVIARKDSYGFWDFLTHGPHGNISPSDGIDFDFEIELIDLQAGAVLDVEPSLHFHWHWREGPLTPSFYPVTPSEKEIEPEND
jgi:hypothetical protein